MNTKKWITAIVLSVVLWPLPCYSATALKASNRPPNIIYILADDLGFGDLSCNGQTHFQTPNIDRLAAEGMEFTQHYAGDTVCAPSRCSLMTGLHTGHTQVRGNKEIEPEGQAPMESGTVTIPTLLKKGGYVSGMFGKWGLGFPGSASDPMVFFDEFYGYNCQRYAHRYYPAYLWHNDKKVELEGNHWINKNTFAPDLIHKKALAFIEKNNPKKTGQPFFLYYPSTIPHAELIAPQDEILKGFLGKFDEIPYPGGNTDDLTRAPYGPNMSIPAYCPQKNPKAAYAALITRLDRQVGEIIDKLKELGIDDNTIVIFTSDNGAHAEGGIHPEYFNSNGKWRGMKRDLYEGGIRVPMIVRWPGKVKAGTTSDHISAFWDMLPTFCEIGGVAAPSNIDGISMLPVLLGQDGEQKQHEYLYWEFPAQGARQAIRKDQWKGVRLNVQNNSEAEIELYNLEDDPKETENVADEYPEIVWEMKGLFKQARVESEAFPLFATAGLDKVWVYPGPDGINPSDQYSLAVEQGGNVYSSFVYKTTSKNPNDHNKTKLPHLYKSEDAATTSYSTFSFKGSIVVRVTKLTGRVQSVRVKPSRFGIHPQLVGNTAIFTLDRPTKVSVEFNEDVTHSMLVFADPPEKDIPQQGDPGVKFLGPGVHNIGKINPISSNTTIYIAGGAFVQGMHQGKNLKNVTIRGRGVVSGEIFPYCGKCMDENMFEMEGDNLNMEGITIVGTPHFAMRFRKGQNHSVRNVKNIAWYASTDGIGSVGDNSLIEDCFIKVNDDHIKLYSKNLTVRNVIIWPYISGSPFQWGYGPAVDGSCTHVSNVDIINSGLGWREGGNRAIFCASRYRGSTSNYVFENIYIEGPVYRLIKLYGGGRISNVTFKNIVLTHPAQMENIVDGTYSDFTFDNLIIDGHAVTQASGAFFPSGPKIENLRFIHDSTQ